MRIRDLTPDEGTLVEWWYECENTEVFPLVRKGDPDQVIRAYEDCDYVGYVWGEVQYDTLVIVCPTCDYEVRFDYEEDQ